MWAFDSNIKDPAVRTYIQNLERTVQLRFLALADFFHTLMPQADIVLKYGMPTFFYGKSILHIAGWKGHCGVYPQAEAIQVFAHELDGYACSKGAIQLPHEKEIPFDVLRKIALYRLKQIQHGSSPKNKQ